MAAALVLLLIASLLWLADDGFRTPRGDWHLDAAPQRLRATAEVLSVGAEVAESTTALQPVTFRFALPGGAIVHERGFVPAGALRPGTQHAVEFLADDAAICRLEGGYRARATVWLPAVAGRGLLPALLALLVWLSRVHQSRVLLRHGTAAPARLVARRTIAGLALVVRHAFAAGDREQQASQWVWRGSGLGRTLRAVPLGVELQTAFAVHDAMRPQRCRLVCLADVALEAE